MKKIIYVNQNILDKNYYSTVQDAINAVSKTDEAVEIHIAPGIYEEQVFLERPNITFKGLGASPEETEICGHLAAFDEMPDGTKRGTFRSYTFFAGANHIYFENLTISNRSGEPKEKGQAIALYADGDDIRVNNCRLIGRQDTLFTGPLPPKEVIPGGFIGPRQFAERINGHQLYENCYICGDVDFIFGSATAYFDNCTIEALVHNPKKLEPDSIQGYCTAGSTPEGQSFGYVFNHCRFTASDALLSETFYLGRPWREYAKTVFLNCEIGNHIHQDGFHDWNKPLAHEVSFYATYNCKRPDGSAFVPTASFASVLKDEDAASYSRTSVLGF